MDDQLRRYNIKRTGVIISLFTGGCLIFFGLIFCFSIFPLILYTVHLIRLPDELRDDFHRNLLAIIANFFAVCLIPSGIYILFRSWHDYPRLFSLYGSVLEVDDLGVSIVSTRKTLRVPWTSCRSWKQFQNSTAVSFKYRENEKEYSLLLTRSMLGKEALEEVIEQVRTHVQN